MGEKQNPKVLIIDAEAFDVKKIVTHLRNIGIESKAVRNGDVGVETFFDLLPDLVLVNMLLPDHSGIDVVKRIRGRGFGVKVPIYILSPLASGGENIIKGSGATGLISKPVNNLELNKILAKHFPNIQFKRPESAEKTSAKKTEKGKSQKR